MRSFSYTTFPCSCTTWLLPSYATTQPPSMSVVMAAPIPTAPRHVKAGPKLTPFHGWPTVRSHHGGTMRLLSDDDKCERRTALATDRLSAVKQRYEQEGAGRSNLRYGHV